MPLTEKGKEIESAMEQRYGAKKGESVFYASKNAGKITGVDSVPEHRGVSDADLSARTRATPEYKASVGRHK